MAVMGIVRARDDTKYPIGREYRNEKKPKMGTKCYTCIVTARRTYVNLRYET